METIAGLDIKRLKEVAQERFGNDNHEHLQKVAIMIATAHCAKISYNNHGAGVDYKKDIKLFNNLKEAGHYSPFEHCARAMSEKEYNTHIRGKCDEVQVNDGQQSVAYECYVGSEGWSGNIKGFIQLRQEL